MYLIHTLTVFIGMKFDWCYRFVWKELDNHLWTHTDTHTQWIKLSRNRLSNKNVCVYEILNEHTHTFIQEKKQKQNEKQSMNWIKLNGIYTIQSCESIEFFFAIAGDEFLKKKSVMNRFHPHKQPSSSSSSSSEWFIDESIELKL